MNKYTQYFAFMAFCRLIADNTVNGCALIDGALITAALQLEGYHYTYKWLHRNGSRLSNVTIAYRYY